MATVQAGLEGQSLGVEGGLSGLRSRPLGAAEAVLSLEAHAFAWAETKGVRVLAEYQAYFNPPRCTRSVWCSSAIVSRV